MQTTPDHFTPKTIYYQKAVKDDPITKKILNNATYKNTPKVEYIDKRSELNSLEYTAVTKNDPMFYTKVKHNHDKGRSILAIKQGAQPLVREDPRKSDVVSMDIYRRNDGKIYEVKLGANCSFRCHYCYLYGANNNNPEVAVYTNVAGMKKQMAAVVDKLNGKPVVFNAGEHTDSLALDPITGLTTELVPFIPSLKNALMELRTKSANVDNLKELAHKKKTIVAWSVTPQEVINQTEYENATPFNDRLKAMIKVQDWGYPIALKLDPIIPIDSYERYYKEVIDLLKSELNPELIHHFAVGVLRVGGKLKGMIKEMYAGELINKLDFPTLRHGKWTHSDDQRKAIYNYAIPLMKSAFPGLPYYISMEDKTTAKEIMAAN